MRAYDYSEVSPSNISSNNRCSSCGFSLVCFNCYILPPFSVAFHKSCCHDWRNGFWINNGLFCLPRIAVFMVEKDNVINKDETKLKCRHPRTVGGADAGMLILLRRPAGRFEKGEASLAPTENVRRYRLNLPVKSRRRAV